MDLNNEYSKVFNEGCRWTGGNRYTPMVFLLGELAQFTSYACPATRFPASTFFTTFFWERVKRTYCLCSISEIYASTIQTTKVLKANCRGFCIVVVLFINLETCS
ncbi:hypothetical protein O6H91_19G052700 [Diphasiastrum complanatum]|uniref:Uncharacterized protein n=1 Tax=Diphasiastrum complanatum TaxID=34168 RepID=A0ACC2AV47_DIPCM|nr:hypothetical protein O6H91_19G052700 [Diphasiastrum complanatum]